MYNNLGDGHVFYDDVLNSLATLPCHSLRVSLDVYHSLIILNVGISTYKQ